MDKCLNFAVKIDISGRELVLHCEATEGHVDNIDLMIFSTFFMCERLMNAREDKSLEKVFDMIRHIANTKVQQQ